MTTNAATLGREYRVTLHRDRCVSVATRSLHRWGWLSVLVGKFLIGVRMTIPPLAGGIQMSYGRFLALDLVGASAWAGLFASLGYAFHHQISVLLHVVKNLNAAIETVLTLAILALLAKRLASQPNRAGGGNRAELWERLTRGENLSRVHTEKVG